jgi:anti-sigma factor RsiW
MNRCPETPRIQDWLDGELAPGERARFEAHLASCPHCEADAAAYRVVLSELRAVPLLDPRPELFDRVMDAVLPHRPPRWVRVLGLGYATALAGSLAAIGSAFVLPGPSAWLRGIVAAATRALTETGTFVVRSLGDGLARTGETLAGGGAAGRFLKLLGSALAHPGVWITMIAAVAVCAALFWWMRPRERRGEMPHVGLLGL